MSGALFAIIYDWQSYTGQSVLDRTMTFLLTPIFTLTFIDILRFLVPYLVRLLSCFCLSTAQLKKWWDEVAYLGDRSSVVIHSSPAMVGPKLDIPDMDAFVG